MTKKATKPPLVATDPNALIKDFRRDLELYCKACLQIRRKDATLNYLEFNEAQAIVHEKISQQRKETGRVRAIVLKARQEGVSTYVAARFLRRLHLWPATSAMVVADSLERAGVLYDIYARYYDHLPPELAPTRKAVGRRKHLSFVHDSDISVRPASDTEAGRAQTIHLLHASELAYWGTTGYEAWISLMQAVPQTNSEIIIESTAKGAGGLFHEMWEAAVNGESNWLAIFLPWWIHAEYEMEPDDETRDIILNTPDDFEKQALTEGIYYEGQHHVLSLHKLAWRRAVIIERFGGDRQRLGRDAVRNFQQEYPATAEEAFLVSGACFFDEDQIRLMTRTSGEANSRGMLQVNGESLVVYRPNPRGFLRVFQNPDNAGHYVIGADTAEGKLIAERMGGNSASTERGGRDFSSAVVLRTDTDEVVAELHGRIAPEVFAEQLRLLGNWYSCGEGQGRSVALIGVERSHSSGQTVLRLLREHYRYPRLFWHREMNKLTRRTTRTLGWKTTVETRMPMLDDLGQKVRLGQIQIPSKDIVREMVTFVIWENGKPMAEEGCHDDRVIALAIANQMAREHRHGWQGDSPMLYEPTDELTG